MNDWFEIIGLVIRIIVAGVMITAALILLITGLSSNSPSSDKMLLASIAISAIIIAYNSFGSYKNG